MFSEYWGSPDRSKYPSNMSLLLLKWEVAVLAQRAIFKRQTAFAVCIFAIYDRIRCSMTLIFPLIINRMMTRTTFSRGMTNSTGIRAFCPGRPLRIEEQLVLLLLLVLCIALIVLLINFIFRLLSLWFLLFFFSLDPKIQPKKPRYTQI